MADEIEKAIIAAIKSWDKILVTSAIKIAQQTKQTVGEKREYYITLEQLERMLILKQEAQTKKLLNS